MFVTFFCGECRRLGLKSEVGILGMSRQRFYKVRKVSWSGARGFRSEVVKAWGGGGGVQLAVAEFHQGK